MYEALVRIFDYYFLFFNMLSARVLAFETTVFPFIPVLYYLHPVVYFHPLQLMKAAVPAESYVIYLFIFLHHLESPAMSKGSNQVGAALSPSF